MTNKPGSKLARSAAGRLSHLPEACCHLDSLKGECTFGSCRCTDGYVGVSCSECESFELLHGDPHGVCKSHATGTVPTTAPVRLIRVRTSPYFPFERHVWLVFADLHPSCTCDPPYYGTTCSKSQLPANCPQILLSMAVQCSSSCGGALQGRCDDETG